MTVPRFPRHFELGSLSEIGRDAAASHNPGGVPESSAAEVILSSDGGTLANVRTRPRRATRARGIFVPENYEPTYAYPLVVWLHAAGRSERDIVNVLPMISTRNYIGLALRGSVPVTTGNSTRFTWSRSFAERHRLQHELHASVRDLRQDFHLHTERIFLVGEQDGATEAWELFLNRPEWFAGLAVLGGEFPWGRRALRRYRDLHGRRVLLAADDPSATDSLRRLLHAGGLDVSIGLHDPSDGRPPGILRQIDRWIMTAIGGCQ